jgi:NAD dependent epimerase/dehydratase family enzyme
MLRLAIGESTDMILNSRRVVPRVALEGNYKFRFNKLDIALICI